MTDHTAESKPYRAELEPHQRAFADRRLGMFVCYNIMSYGAQWGEADVPASAFTAERVDFEQWARVAKSAHMTFGLLTTKHHEGFCLWKTQTTDYGVSATECDQDIVQEFVDAFRAQGLRVGLYFSIWDSTHGIEKGQVTPEKIALIKAQITELLTNYGEIDFFVIDGWYWRMGHREVPFSEIRELIRELQPHCLLTDHTHLQALYHVDFPYFEGPFGAFPPEDNTLPSAFGMSFVEGNGWFWGPNTPDSPAPDVDEIVATTKQLESRYCTLMMNCMPNRKGRLDDVFVETLAEIGEKWSPDLSRPPLPAQGHQLTYPVQPVAVAATSGDASDVIRGQMFSKQYLQWSSAEPLPQSVTLDLGTVYAGIEMLQWVPEHAMFPERSLREGNITRYETHVSIDGINFTPVDRGACDADGKAKASVFEAVSARYVRLTALESHGGRVSICEMAVGGYSSRPTRYLE